MGLLTSATWQGPELLIRMADAGATYVSWSWSATPANIQADRMDPRWWTEAVAALTAAVPEALTGGMAGVHSLRRTLESGAFGSSETESHLAELFGRALPIRLRDALISRSGQRPVVRLSPSATAARVPWALADLDGKGTRLLDIADVLLEPPTLVHRGRSRIPVPDTGGPPLWVVDPQLPLAALGGGMSQVIAQADLDFYSELWGRIRGADSRCVVQDRFGREDLSDALRAGPGRFVYLGHATGSTDQPAASALHLSDTLTPEQVVDGDWGAAQPWSPGMTSGRRRPKPGDPLPLTALDLVTGGRLRGAGRPEMVGPGHALWPMPRNVVLLGCESGIDYAASETFGLATAVIDSGAEFVSATLWTVPTDEGMRAAIGEGQGYRPLADLLWACDLAHSGVNPAVALCNWQRSRLNRWRESGSVVDSPLIWAAVTTTHAPANEESS